MSGPGGIVLAAFTRAGALLAARLAGALGGRAFVPGRCLVPGTEPLEGTVGDWAELWSQFVPYPEEGAALDGRGSGEDT